MYSATAHLETKQQQQNVVYGIITRKKVCVFTTNTFFYIYLCWGSMPMEARRQPAGAGALLPPCGVFGVELVYQAPAAGRCLHSLSYVTGPYKHIFLNKMFLNLQMPNSQT